MFDAIGQIPYRQTVLAVFVLIVFGTSAAEMASEFVDGETLGSMGTICRDSPSERSY